MAEPRRQESESGNRRRGPRDFPARHAASTGVSAALRAARVEAGLELADVAGALRIQYRYLEAIEDGRFADLPGPTYAIGFVRAYGEFLRLDAKELIRQFKDEVSGLDRRQALVFPEPLQEGRFPGGAVLLVALLLAVAVYGSWYYWEHRQMTAADGVPPVPASIAREVPASPPPAPAPSEAQASSAAAAAPADPRPAAAESAAATPLAAAPSQAAPGPRNPLPPPAPQEAAPAAELPAAPPQRLVLRPPEGMGTSDPGRSAVPLVPPPPGAAAPPAPDQLAALRPGEPRLYGESNLASRVTLTARQDSWVQVRDRDGTVLWTRVLRPGESYRAPNQPGLSFATGNAGALDVTVDGKPVPALGAVGVVRRNIPLDPEKLAAGALPSQ